MERLHLCSSKGKNQVIEGVMRICYACFHIMAEAAVRIVDAPNLPLEAQRENKQNVLWVIDGPIRNNRNLNHLLL